MLQFDNELHSLKWHQCTETANVEKHPVTLTLQKLKILASIYI